MTLLLLNLVKVFSDFFLVNNGVRQGGILSPLLFNVNELSESLSKLPIGCCCGNTVVNHLMYLTILFYLLHQQRDCKRLSMCVMHMVVIMILYLIAQNHK